MEVRVHPRLEHRDATELVELSRVGVIVEGAGDKDVEVRVAGFLRCLHEIRTGDSAELGATVPHVEPAPAGPGWR